MPLFKRFFIKYNLGYLQKQERLMTVVPSLKMNQENETSWVRLLHVQSNHAIMHIMWFLLNAGMSRPELNQSHKAQQYMLTESLKKNFYNKLQSKLQAFKYAIMTF